MIYYKYNNLYFKNMGRYYYGDIEGKFAFAIQSSYDPEFFGFNPIEIHYWTCGCCSEYGEKPENCECIVEHVHDSDCEEQTQSLNTNIQTKFVCNKTEDENIQCDQPSTLKFMFDEFQIEDIKQKLDDILDFYPEDKKELFFNFMDNCKSYNEKMISENVNIPQEDVMNYLQMYYRYKLGKKIYDYLLEHGSCVFYGDV